MAEKERIHFGSLEKTEQDRLDAGGAAAANPQAPATVGVADLMELSEESKESREKHELQVKKLQMEMRARTISAPTNDGQVKSLLRQNGEPICLFGEGPAERRDRLKEVLARMEVIEGVSVERRTGVTPPPEDEKQVEIFFTEGTPALKAARMAMAVFSLPKAAERVAGEKRKRAAANERAAAVAATAAAAVSGDHDAMADAPPADPEVVKKDAMSTKLGSFTNYSSQIGDERPVSGCAFSRQGALATVSWSGACKVWDVPSCKVNTTLRGHKERVTGLAWHPTTIIGGDGACLATGSADATVKLWKLDGNGKGSAISTLVGHTDRVARIAYHPSGQYLASASFDRSWRLWDVECGKELLLQEGHSRPVYAVAFQNDGALAASVGLDCICRVWDNRTGRNIITFKGHVKQVLDVDFHPNGFQLATASDDNSVKVWDLRRKALFYTIPAHASIVSSVKYSPDGTHLLTGSYDHTVKLWRDQEYTMVKALSGHNDKVMGAAFSDDGRWVASASYDRTWKLWGHEDE